MEHEPCIQKNSPVASPPGHRLLCPLSMLFVTTLLVANTIATKLIDVGGFILPAGIICFPIAYIFGDVLTEVYGYSQTRRVIWSGFLCLALMSLFYYISVLLPPAEFWTEQSAFASLFRLAPRIAASSLLAYLVGSFLNSYVLSRMKLATNGKHLWMRTIGSTIIGEGADSIIFNFVAFVGVFTIEQVCYIAASGFLLKATYEIIATPATYLVVAAVKRIEAEDVYDVGVDYSPFRV